MRTFFILSSLLCGAVVNAADYAYDVNVNGPGGAYVVGSGETKVVTEDCTYDNLYSVDEGGAIYMGANARLELQGNHTFSNNAQWAYEKGMGIWYGFYNDIYLSGGATLTLNPVAESDVISLGGGLYSEEDTSTSVVKKGAGKLIFGSLSDNSGMYTNLTVEAGTVEMRNTVNTSSVRVADGASVFVDSLNEDEVISLFVGTTWAEEIVFSSNGAGITLSGVDLSASGVSSVGAEKGSISGASVGVYSDSRVAVDNVSLVDSYIWADSAITLSNVSLDADSSVIASVEAILSGDNYVELNSLTSTQLQGVTLADGATLTLTLSEDLLSGVGEDFNIILEDLSLAEDAVVTLNVKLVDGATSSVTMSGYTQESGGVKIEMRGDATVPEPTSATLSLLALAVLSARRRRSA